MRKLLLLGAVALVAASSTGCNCLRNRCGGGGGWCGGLFGGHNQAYAAAAPMCCPQPQVQCCPPVQCCDPCAGATVVGSPVIDGGASCCN